MTRYTKCLNSDHKPKVLVLVFVYQISTRKEGNFFLSRSGLARATNILIPSGVENSSRPLQDFTFYIEKVIGVLYYYITIDIRNKFLLWIKRLTYGMSFTIYLKYVFAQIYCTQKIIGNKK